MRARASGDAGSRSAPTGCRSTPSTLFLLIILALVVYLTLTKKDQTPSEITAADDVEAEARKHHHVAGEVVPASSEAS